ncbi:MAG: ATP-binding cassette domain-containing protein [Desulfuromonadaceae bacterium]|nr:ATP-binding cassette domain-containing protein [Desulfuromonadaceae bacterium]
MVSLEGLVKVRSQSESVFELHVPRFAVLPGQMVAVVGESGCGKSTLLDILALVMAPTRVARFQIDPGSGPVCDVAALWQREDEGALARLRRDSFGYVLQTGGLLPFLSVRGNVRLPGRLKGEEIPPERLETLSRRLGVAGCLERMPLSLSIGQRQRVAILRALAHRPRLLLADEPTAAVDQNRARTIMEDMRHLARDEGVAVVVVTHDVDLVMDRADRAYTFATEEIDGQTTRSVCRPLPESSS